MNTKDWRKPTKHIDRVIDAITLLCGGKKPPRSIVEKWFDSKTDEADLQEFCIEHGPSWAQGCVVIDAALLLAKTPTEILTPDSEKDHEIDEVILSMSP